MKKHNSNQSGIALMIVLWVLVLLMALATEFAFSMKMEVNTTRNYKEDAESYYLAKAGLNRMNLGHEITAVLEWDTCLPAVAQVTKRRHRRPATACHPPTTSYHL